MALLLFAALALAAARYGPGLVRQAWTAARVFWKTRSIPGPASGVLSLMGPMDQMLDRVRAAISRYGSVVRVDAWPIVCIFISEPEDLEVLFTNPHLQQKPAIVYTSLAPILGDGLATLNGDVHRRHRKAITPSLHLEVLQGFLPVFERNARGLCRRLEALAVAAARGGGPAVVNAKPLMAYYSAQTVCETVYSAETTPGLEEEQASYIKYLMQSSALLYHRVMRPWYNVDCLFYFSSQYEGYQKVVRGFDSFVTKILDHKKEQLRHGLPPSSEGASSRRKAFLDHVLTSSEASVLGHRDLVEELKTLSAGAVGTTMDLMSFFLILNAMYPDVQDRIVKELDDIFGGSDRAVEADDLPHMQYLECALKETLRLFPVLFTFSRSVRSDVKLPSGHVLPEGSVVSSMPYLTHRDPRYFPDPERFDPSRFLPENTRQRHPYAFVPFSAGARNCIGQRYAVMSAKVLASTLLRRFRFAAAPGAPRSAADIKCSVGVALSPVTADVVVERRTRTGAEPCRRG